MSRSLRTVYRVLLVLLVTFAIVAAFWFGLVPQRFSPFSPISLETRQWFVDPRLSALRYDPALCLSVLKAPHIDATPIPDNPIKNGCGWTNAVRFSTTGGAKIGVEPLTCEMAAAVTLWVEHEVQPLAMEMFGKRVDVARRHGHLRLPQHRRQSVLEGRAQPARDRQRARHLRLHARGRPADQRAARLERQGRRKASSCTRRTGARAAISA